jgi:hypothetical protein
LIPDTARRCESIIPLVCLTAGQRIACSRWAIVGIDLETPIITIIRKAIRELNILKKGINRKIRKRLRIEAEAEDVKSEAETRETLEVTNY